MQNISNSSACASRAIALPFVPEPGDERAARPAAALSPGASAREELANGAAWENLVWLSLAVSGLGALVISLWI